MCLCVMSPESWSTGVVIIRYFVHATARHSTAPNRGARLRSLSSGAGRPPFGIGHGKVPTRTCVALRNKRLLFDRGATAPSHSHPSPSISNESQRGFQHFTSRKSEEHTRHGKTCACSFTHAAPSDRYQQAQTPQQRRANEQFAKTESAKRGKPVSAIKKKEKPEKAPINKIWLCTMHAHDLRHRY